MQETERKDKKGRAGMVMGRREGIRKRKRGWEGKKGGNNDRKGEFRRRVMDANRSLCKQGHRREDRKIKRWMENGEEGVRVLIGRDFNTRTGREEGSVGEDGEEWDKEEKRKLKDRKFNGEGRKMYGFFKELGWLILNGNVEGDEEEKWTYTGGTVIDYILGNEKTRKEVRRMRKGSIRIINNR